MKELCYSALDVAAIVSGMDLGCQEESRLVEKIWDTEKVFIEMQYRSNKRKFILDVCYWMHYFYENPILDREFPAIQKTLEGSNYGVCAESYMNDFLDLDLFFKSVRIKIVYGDGKDYVRIKLRTLLKEYGYQRRSNILMQHIERCMLFYHLEATLRGGIECDMNEIGLDNMVVFRVV